VGSVPAAEAIGKGFRCGIYCVKEGMALDFLIYSLAAVGFVCILWAIYGILLSGLPQAKECAELYLFLDGHSPGAEHLLRAAYHARQRFLPGLPVTFIDTGEGCEPLKQLAGKLDIDYSLSSPDRCQQNCRGTAPK